MMMGGIFQMAVALIALSMGYRLFLDATREKKESHRTLGRIIAIYVMILAFSGSAWTVFKFSCARPGGAHNVCPVMKACFLK